MIGQICSTGQILFRAKPLGARKCPREQHPTAAGQHVLPTVEFVRDGRTRDARARTRVPKRFSVARIERQEVAQSVAGKGEP